MGSIKSPKQFISTTAIVSLALLTMLSGCFDKPKNALKVQEPPYIPALPQPEESEEAPKPLAAMDIRAYADLMELGDTSRHHPKLADAVSNAIRAGVIRPATLDERFDPSRAITYGEFRTWALSWQNALADAGYGIQVSSNGKSLNRNQAPKANADEPRELIPSRHNVLGDPMNPEKLMILPESPEWGSLRMNPNQPLNRETLCALYVFLTQQEAKARALTPEKIESAAPGTNELNTDEALSEFKDSSALSPWARRYVAVAYQDRMLQHIFRLTPDKLTVDDGFSPQRTISREDAVVLLDRLYGKFRVSAPRPTGPTEATEGLLPAETLNGTEPRQLLDTPGTQSGRIKSTAAPVASRTTYTETAPGYSRQADRITSPH
ncbi:MAG TPA: S-layer homology domain-containing protein [Coleofasciculaceae cyanobacterium]|jgi:hypothetical protein